MHVYTDGSVSVSHRRGRDGAGGATTSCGEVAARAFGIDRQRVRVETTSTARVANTSPTAASTGADLNGQAVELACLAILASGCRRRRRPSWRKSEPAPVEIREEQVFCGGQPTALTWARLVRAAYLAPRQPLRPGALRHARTSHFDSSAGKGEPFAYHVFGTAVVEVTLDCLRGTYHGGRACSVVHDAGAEPGPAGRPRAGRGRASSRASAG